jgi:riboflavin synthase
VDGLATLVSVEPEGSSRRMTFELKPELVRYCVEKGSIALNGTSLTLSRILSGASCAGDAPSRILPEQVVVHVIPHTWAETNLGELKPGDPVNCEVDIFAKYVERLCQPYQQR